MRRGTKLIALSALGALTIPVPGHAVQASASADFVREVVVTARVKHLSTGRTGPMTFTLRSSQGASFTKPPLRGQLDDYALEQHVGQGLPEAVSGLPKFTGCLDLRVTGVVNHVDRCQVYGSTASLEADPLLNEVSVSVTMGPGTEYKTSIVMGLAASGNPAHETKDDVVETNPTIKGPGGYHVLRSEFLVRPGVIVGGAIFDEAPGAGTFTFVPTTEKVTLREGIVVESEFIRLPLVCGEEGGRPIPIGAPNAGVTVDQLDQSGQQPKPGPDGNPDGIIVPPGCHPDDEIEPLPLP